jgi:hypothetical protein
MTQHIFIGPYETGLQKNVEPFMLPQEAFSVLEDAYVWRERVKKKDGYTFLGRLHRTPTLPEALANVATGAAVYNATLANAPVSPGTVTIVISTPGPITFTDNGNGTLTSPTATANWGTIDYESGTFNLNFDPVLPGGGPFAVNATAYRFLTRSPAMGLGLYENILINEEDLIAHDEDHSYLFNTGTSIFDELTTGSWGANDQWTSSNSDFVWTTNYFTDASNNKLHWATNNIAYNANLQDGIQYFNGTTWTMQQARIDSAAPNPNFLRGGLIVIPYRNRLVVLNTLEGADPTLVPGSIRYPQRARWSQNGTPLLAVGDEWRADIIGKGGFIDAPTSEAIVSAAFNKDTLIVFFERSTWRLVYTRNEILPFVWEQINSEFGAESTFSNVIFDRGVLAVGDKRIVSADTRNVEPVDVKIPDEVFNFHNDNEGPTRVHGIRDYFRQIVYWTFPNDDANEIFPDKMLVYNYMNNSWAIFNDSFTTFGRWQKRTDYTWDTIPYDTWSEWDTPWGSPTSQSFFPNIIAGNQKGFVVTFENTTTNQESLDLVNTIPTTTISNTAPAIFTLPNHNLKINSFIKIVDCPAFGVNVVAEAMGTAPAGSTQFIATLANLGVFPSTAVVTLGALSYQDLGDGTLIETTGGVNTGTINYQTGQITINYAALGAATPVTVNYTYNILNYRVFKVATTTANTFTLLIVNADESTDSVNFNTFGAPYTGTGKIQIVNNFKIRTKRFSPYMPNALSLRMSYADLFLLNVPITFKLQVLADQDATRVVNDLNVCCIDDIAENLTPEKNWKRVFTNTISDFIQFQLQMSDFQVTQFENYSSPWELHAMSLIVAPAGRLVGGA